MSNPKADLMDRLKDASGFFCFTWGEEAADPSYSTSLGDDPEKLPAEDHQQYNKEVAVALAYLMVTHPVIRDNVVASASRLYLSGLLDDSV